MLLKRNIYVFSNNIRLLLCHEEFKEKKFELELSWITPATNY